MKIIQKVAVLGAGTMGSRIAAHLANAGVPSYLLDIVPPGQVSSDDAGRNRIASAGLESARKSKPAAFFEPSLSRLITTGNFEDDLKVIAGVDQGTAARNDRRAQLLSHQLTTLLATTALDSHHAS